MIITISNLLGWESEDHFQERKEEQLVHWQLQTQLSREKLLLSQKNQFVGFCTQTLPAAHPILKL